MNKIETFNRLSFDKLKDGKYYYHDDTYNSFTYELDSNYISNEKTFEITINAKNQLTAVYNHFLNLLQKIKTKDELFSYAEGDECLMAYRSIFKENLENEHLHIHTLGENKIYQLIILNSNGDVYCDTCEIQNLTRSISYYNYQHTGNHNNNEEYDEDTKKLILQLYNSASHDRYLYLSLKYILKMASQEEINEVCSIDKLGRFLVENKVYDDEITINRVHAVSLMYLRSFNTYFISITINSKVWKATWYPERKNSLLIHTDFSLIPRINISDRLVSIINTHIENGDEKLLPTTYIGRICITSFDRHFLYNSRKNKTTLE